MNIIQKIAIAGTTGALLLSSVTPTFAAASAWNKNINKSFVKSVAVDNDFKKAEVTNTFTFTKSITKSDANTGGNVQVSGKSDGNTIKTGDAEAKSFSNTEVNKTVINF